MASKNGPQPTGECWCGCGKKTNPGRFFRQNHDRVAESAVIKVEYGGIAQFLAAHGYEPSGKNPISERDRRRGEDSRERSDAR